MNESVAEQLLEKLDSLERKITALPDRSWSLHDCADYMQVSYTTAYRMSKQPGFPKPTKPQTNSGGSRMLDRYEPAEFKKWFYSSVNRAS